MRLAALLLLAACSQLPPSEPFASTRTERWRPQVHFSPAAGWLNDPVGLVRFGGQWHLYFQHNPDADVWGPMHWGHAVSEDLLHWEERPVALAPDPVLGTVFSGSAIALDAPVDGVCAEPCIVAMFTHNGGDSGDQKQSLATSTDGERFAVHPASPVIANPGLRDFRDPRLMRHEGGFRALISEGEVLGAYDSEDLLAWTRVGEVPFAVDGVLETPDVVTVGEADWLALAVNPGGPAGGSGQAALPYPDPGDGGLAPIAALGWMDHGPDFYAFQAWSEAEVDGGPVGIAWASNWAYALRTPTAGWRGAMSVPRVLSGDGEQLVQRPVDVSPLVRGVPVALAEATPRRRDAALADFRGEVYLLRYRDAEATACTVRVREGEGAVTAIRWDGDTLAFDRANSGESDFDDGFAAVHTAPLLAEGFDVELLVDTSMVELFADGGRVAFTERIFPPEGADGVSIACEGSGRVDLTIVELQSIWQ